MSQQQQHQFLELINRDSKDSQIPSMNSWLHDFLNSQPNFDLIEQEKLQRLQKFPKKELQIARTSLQVTCNMLTLPWKIISVDDYVCDYKGLTLRAELMDKDWWWTVYFNKHEKENNKQFASYDALEQGFPVAYSGEDACFFAETFALHYLQYHNTNLWYHPHKDTINDNYGTHLVQNDDLLHELAYEWNVFYKFNSE